MRIVDVGLCSGQRRSEMVSLAPLGAAINQTAFPLAFVRNASLVASNDGQ